MKKRITTISVLFFLITTTCMAEKKSLLKKLFCCCWFFNVRSSAQESVLDPNEPRQDTTRNQIENVFRGSQDDFVLVTDQGPIVNK